MPEPLVVASLVAPVDLGMDADNEDNPGGDKEKNLIEYEVMIDLDWPPSNLNSWVMGDTLDKMSIPDDAPQVEDQEGITSSFKFDEKTGTYWETLCLLSKSHM